MFLYKDKDEVRVLRITSTVLISKIGPIDIKRSQIGERFDKSLNALLFIICSASSAVKDIDTTVLQGGIYGMSAFYRHVYEVLYR